MDPNNPQGRSGTVKRQATVLESVEEIRSQVRAATQKEHGIGPGGSSTVGAPADPSQDTKPFRPTMRPAMALLYVLDDGDDSGEIIRLRSNTFVVGRVEGDLVIPHDSGISKQHAEISRRFENGEFNWYLRDLQSTNGTFVRASTVVLHHEQEILVGSSRFRFESAGKLAEQGEPEMVANTTRKYESPSKAGLSATRAALPPTLVEVALGSEARRFLLTDDREHWIGRDPRQCTIVVSDPTVDRRHARISRDEKSQRWIVANERSRNGLWARAQEVALGRGGYFQCGEQRFLFKVL